MNRRALFLAATIFAGAASAGAGEFSISFTWEGLKSCTNGYPNTVKNPRFQVVSVPKGTTVIEFRLRDKDVPGYNHGGGSVAMNRDGMVPRGVFTYKSPCPPGGRHKYEWTATAKDRKGFGAKRLGVARAVRFYPE